MSDPKTDLEQLFSRLAESLDASLAPHIHDHYATMQLRAVREMLLNLGARVEWRHADTQAGEQSLRQALDNLAQTKDSRSAIRAPELRAELAHVIDGIYDSTVDEVRREISLAEIWRVIRSDFDVEAQRIKTGMFT